MKTYENLKRSYGKFLNLEFYVYEPDIKKREEKDKYEILYEPIINVNKDCGFIEIENGHYYVSEVNIDNLVISDDIYHNLLLKALAFNLSYYGVPHFDEIYATAAEDDLKGTVRQLRAAAGKLLLLYCDKKNILIKFTEKDYTDIGDFIGRHCIFSDIYIYKTVNTVDRAILTAKKMMNCKLTTFDPFLTKIHPEGFKYPIYYINDINIVNDNRDCVALKKNGDKYYVSSRSLGELIISQKYYGTMLLRLIVSNLDRIGLKELPDAQTDILKYALIIDFDTVERLSSYWLINFCQQKGMFPNSKENMLKAIAILLNECGEFPKKCAELIQFPQITKVESSKEKVDKSNRRDTVHEYLNQYSKEIEIRSFNNLINQCRRMFHWKEPIVCTPLLTEVKRFLRKSDTYIIQDERIIKINKTNSAVMLDGNQYKIKKEDIKWIIIPDSIYDDVLLDLMIGNIDHFGNFLLDRDTNMIVDFTYNAATSMECAKWLLDDLIMQGFMDRISASLYDNIYQGLIKDGTFPARCFTAVEVRKDKELDEEIKFEKQMRQDEKDAEAFRNDY